MRLAAFLLAPFLPAALLLAGCGGADQGRTYPVEPREARAALLLVEPPLELFGSQVANARATRDGDGTVHWLLLDDLGSGLLTLSATTREAGEGKTRIAVLVEPPPGGRHDAMAKRLADKPAIAGYFRAAMEEQIAATLEHREFDMAAVQGQMMMAALALAPEMTANVEEAARRGEAQDRANIERAYREEGQGTSDGSYSDTAEPAYGEPMDPATVPGDY